jgi:hypothetical protein
MRLHKIASILAVIAMLGFALACSTPAGAAESSRHIRRHAGRHVGVSYAPTGRRLSGGQTSGFVPLVGDPDSGLGFYPLPQKYQVGAARYRQRRAIQYANDIHYAIASEAIGYDYLFPEDEGVGFGNHHGMFNPIDGYGTPFFAGYYH